MARLDPLCVTWYDDYTDERGFRIVVYYDNSGETFTYTVGPNTTVFVVPEPDRPAASATPCGRSDYGITLFVLRPTGEELVNGFAFDTECRSNRR